LLQLATPDDCLNANDAIKSTAARFFQELPRSAPDHPAPGDGSASTPLLVLEVAIQDQNLSKMLVTLFNDQDANHTQTLQEEINKLPGIETLAHKPEVLCGTARPRNWHLLFSMPGLINSNGRCDSIMPRSKI
jgi:hypothetical protein